MEDDAPGDNPTIFIILVDSGRSWRKRQNGGRIGGRIELGMKMGRDGVDGDAG